MHLLRFHLLQVQHEVFHLLFNQVWLWRYMPASRNHHGNGTVAPGILAVDAVKHKRVYFLDCTLAYPDATFCKVPDVAYCFGVVYGFQVFAHGLARDCHALIHDKLGFLQSKRVALDAVTFVSVFDGQCVLYLFQGLGRQGTRSERRAFSASHSCNMAANLSFIFHCLYRDGSAASRFAAIPSFVPSIPFIGYML